jgi:hypothetical protein
MRWQLTIMTIKLPGTPLTRTAINRAGPNCTRPLGLPYLMEHATTRELPRAGSSFHRFLQLSPDAVQDLVQFLLRCGPGGP